MNGNLPDNVTEHDPRAPWNAPDNVWDVGVLEAAEFECRRCGFTMSGLDLATMEWDDRTVTTAGDPVHPCPACVTDAIKTNGSLDSPESIIGHLVMPHICGVTDFDCRCGEEDRADHQLNHEREVSHVG